MADFATTYTGRYVLTYRSANHSHTHIWRVNTAPGVSSPPALFTTFLHNVYVAMGPAMASDYVYEGAVFYPRDSDASVPAVLPTGEDPLAGSLTNDPGSVANTWSFVGRGAFGSNWKVRWFGIQDGLFNSQNGDFRYQSAESPIVAATITALRAVTALVAIDRGSLTIKDYANVRVDSKYQTSERG